MGKFTLGDYVNVRSDNEYGWIESLWLTGGSWHYEVNTGGIGRNVSRTIITDESDLEGVKQIGPYNVKTGDWLHPSKQPKVSVNGQAIQPIGPSSFSMGYPPVDEEDERWQKKIVNLADEVVGILRSRCTCGLHKTDPSNHYGHSSWCDFKSV